MRKVMVLVAIVSLIPAALLAQWTPELSMKVKTVTAEKKMTWPQVYDGKSWQAAVAQLYGIESIPSTYLVDGDTGEILAADDALRGENLEKTLKQALAKKQKQ